MNQWTDGRWEPTERQGPRLENPMSWSVPMGRIAGIDIRMHLLLPLFAAVELGRSALGHSALGTGPTLLLLGWLLLSVLLHELGHCFACRRFGGRADEVVLWPLGGLAACMPRPVWTAELATSAGGPIVNLVLLLLAGGLLAATGGPIGGVAIPHPFDPAAGLVLVGADRFRAAVYLLGWVNLVLLLVNLVPMLPLDGGVIVRSLLRRSRDDFAATRGAVRVGYGAAIGLAIVGILANQLLLVALAVVGGIWCHRTLHLLIAERDRLGESGDGQFESSWRGEPEESPPSRQEQRAAREAERQQAARAREQAELDRILEKIQRRGMEELNAAERRFLKKATSRRNKE